MTHCKKSWEKILDSDLVSICNNCGGMRRPFLYKDRCEERLRLRRLRRQQREGYDGNENENEKEQEKKKGEMVMELEEEDDWEEYWWRTNYGGDGGRCKFCGKFATRLLLSVSEVDVDDDNDNEKER